jgi:Domain of unknown function (DUF5018)
MKNSIKLSIILCLFAIAWACKKTEEIVKPITPTTPTVVVKSSANDILTFTFNASSPKVNSKIDLINKEITSLLPMETDFKKLTPTITISEKASISPATDIAQDFSKDITYTVTAEDGTAKSFSVKASTDAYFYPNIRMTIGEDKGFISVNDSNLLDYRNGKVYQLKDGAKNAESIDLVLNNYCSLTLSPPIVLKNCGVSCGLGRLNDFVKPQNWPIYRVGDIDLLNNDRNEVKVGEYGYGQINASEWSKIAFADDINQTQTLGRKLDSKNTGNISQTTLVNTNLSCAISTSNDKVLYRFISHDGKKGLLRITNFGKKSSGAYYIVLDIKIQK